MPSTPQHEILEGPIIPTLFVLGWPIMVSSLLHSMYNITDTFWLGRLGLGESTNAVAALQISWPIVFLLIAIAFGFGLAGVALISQYTGSQNPEEANRSAGQVLFMAFVFGIIIGVIGFFATPTIIDMVGVGEGIAHLAITYLQVIFLGMPFQFISMIFGFILRAYGDTITPMKVEGATVLLNVVLDPILIFGLLGFSRMGVFGAASATVFSQCVSASICLYILFSGRSGVKVSLSCLKPVRWRIVQIFRIGVPASIGQSGTALGFVILMFIIARLPNQAAVLAGYGIANRLTNLMFAVIDGFGVGMSTVLGQSLGANNVKRAEEVARKGLILMFLILVVAALCLFVVRREVIQAFIDDDEVISEGATFIWVFVFGMPFFGVFRAVNACFQGSGHNLPMMVAELSRLWGLRIPLSYLFGFVVGWDAVGVWFGMSLSNVLGAVIAFAQFQTGVWKKKVIKEHEVEPMEFIEEE